MPSTFIDIPVLPHVKCLLLSLYGSEPLKLSENTLLGRELQFTFLNKKAAAEKINGETIAIQISHRLTPYFYSFKNAFSLGIFFEKQFHILLFTHIEAQRNCDVLPINAIKNFYKVYSIDESFFSIQSALEAYRRIKYYHKPFLSGLKLLQ